MNLFDLRHDIDHDEWELGLRVAVALFVENVTEPDNFIRIMKLRHKNYRKKG